MKKVLITTCRLMSLTLLFCFARCKKEHTPVNITLYDKPLSVIQSHIQGQWKCHYGKGGFIANMVQYYDNYYWTFTSDNRIKQSYKGTIVADTTIKWIKDRGTYTNGDSTFVMSFYDRQTVPWNYVVDGIFNDTLILHNNYSDAVFYHFTRL